MVHCNALYVCKLSSSQDLVVGLVFNEGFPDAEIKLIAMQNNKVYNFFLEYIIFNTKMLKLLESERNDNIEFNQKVALIQLFLVQSIIKQ